MPLLICTDVVIKKLISERLRGQMDKVHTAHLKSRKPCQEASHHPLSWDLVLLVHELFSVVPWCSNDQDRRGSPTTYFQIQAPRWPAAGPWTDCESSSGKRDRWERSIRLSRDVTENTVWRIGVCYYCYLSVCSLFKVLTWPIGPRITRFQMPPSRPWAPPAHGDPLRVSICRASSSLHVGPGSDITPLSAYPVHLLWTHPIYPKEPLSSSLLSFLYPFPTLCFSS